MNKRKIKALYRNNEILINALAVAVMMAALAGIAHLFPQGI